MAVLQKLFGTIGGASIDKYTISRGDITVEILNYGGIVRSFNVKTQSGEYDIVLGYDTLQEYVNDDKTYFGAAIGRVANRIANGKFVLNGKEYNLAVNNGKNCLHGGEFGFNRKIWAARILDDYSLMLTYFSADGEENFPGNLKVSVVYSLTDRNGLKITYSAETDADTPVNLTNHSYFNLNGEGGGDILGHELALFADKITPVNADMVPTGKFKSVAGTPFDFLSPKAIGKDIDKSDEQLQICGGYDVNYVKTDADDALVARVKGEKSGIIMSVFTTEQGVQFYSGNFLSKTKGKTGIYDRNGGFCLETQKFPNAINCKEYPSPVLKAGEKYESITEYVISF